MKVKVDESHISWWESTLSDLESGKSEKVEWYLDVMKGITDDLKPRENEGIKESEAVDAEIESMLAKQIKETDVRFHGRFFTL